MTPVELRTAYQSAALLQPVMEAIAQNDAGMYRLTGLVGAQRNLVLAALVAHTGRGGLLVLNDREEALYAQNDLESLLPDHRVLLFPASGKRPYQLEHIDNANVLQRAEVLAALNSEAPGRVVVVSFGEALAERVVSRTALVQNTLSLKQGEETGYEFVAEVLESYGFEQVSFVLKPGQYCLRGGIVDVFSFSSDYPYRLEFNGDRIDSIRAFDPVDQLSLRALEQVAVIPDVQNGLLQEERISLLEYLVPGTLLMADNLHSVCADLDKVLQNGRIHFQRLQQQTAEQSLRRKPEDLLLTADDLRAQLGRHHVLEAGKQSLYRKGLAVAFNSSPQAVFRKDFERLVEHLQDLQQRGYRTNIYFDNEKQAWRLKEIFQSLAPNLNYAPVLSSLSEGFVDHDLKLACCTDHQIFDRYHRFRVRDAFKRGVALTLKELTDLKPGDYVTHVNHGVGQFGGLERLDAGQGGTEAVRLLFQGGDVVYVPINALHKISKFSGREGTAPKLSKLGSGDWERKRAKVKKQVKQLAFDLVKLYAERKAKKGHAYSPDTYLQQELEASFLYEDTPDQASAVEAVKSDMEAPHPMDRMVCGDVGFGKTEVAIRAAFKAATDGRQVAVLVPTTILALQHYNTFRDRLEKLPVRVDYINRFRSAKEQKEILRDLKAGKIDILIGTHRLLGKDVEFRDLGLLVIDEEHKFGVAAKEKLRLLRVDIDTLTLTATPIPRTLQFSLLGIRDMSLIATPPPNRRPVDTILSTFDAETIRDAIAYELNRNGQVFFIHNRIKDLEDQAALIKRLVPDARIAVAHGQMDGEKMEQVMLDFMDRRYDVLVCTTIVESGLDISNANTILINQAQAYGLSDLHQLRGRVGRSNRKAFCYLLSPPLHVLPTDARKRLEAVVEFADLGSGTQIAMRDLDIRGAGDILGGEQSGFISEIGLDAYNRILEEAIAELKEEFLLTDDAEAPRHAADTVVEADEPALIPETFLPHVAERLSFYRRIAQCTTDAELLALGRELQDRFGLLPKPVLTLFDTIRLRELAQQLGFERVVVKQGALRGYFPASPDSPFFQTQVFQRLLGYIPLYPRGASLKQVREKLVLQLPDVPDIKAALRALQHLADHVLPKPAPNAENLAEASVAGQVQA